MRQGSSLQVVFEVGLTYSVCRVITGERRERRQMAIGNVHKRRSGEHMIQEQSLVFKAQSPAAKTTQVHQLRPVQVCKKSKIRPNTSAK